MMAKSKYIYTRETEDFDGTRVESQAVFSEDQCKKIHFKYLVKEIHIELEEKRSGVYTDKYAENIERQSIEDVLIEKYGLRRVWVAAEDEHFGLIKRKKGSNGEFDKDGLMEEGPIVDMSLRVEEVLVRRSVSPRELSSALIAAALAEGGEELSTSSLIQSENPGESYVGSLSGFPGLLKG